MSTASPAPAEAFDLVAARLAAGLVAPDVLPAAREAAGSLAPLARCGFRIGLGESREVGVQQRITADEGEPEVLQSHLGRVGSRWSGEETLGRFVARWRDPACALHGSVEEVSLELGGSVIQPGAGASRPPAVSVHAVFRANLGDARRRFEVAEAALDSICARSGWAELRAGAKRCFDACEGDASVGGIGVAVGQRRLRIDVERIHPEALATYLRQVGWPGGQDAGDASFVDEAVSVMARASRLAERVTVCLEVTGTDPAPRLGFECAVSKRSWKPLLDELVSTGLCTPAKRDALLSWPGSDIPVEAPGPWPARLVHDGLLRPADHLTVIKRQLADVTWVYGPGRSPEAIAHVDVGERWLRPKLDMQPASAGADGDGKASRTTPGPGGRTTADLLQGAIARGIDFLLASSTGTGWWHEYPGRGPDAAEWSASIGWSDEWATAFIGDALARVPDARARSTARRVWSLLVGRRRPTDGWGWNRWWPADGDSTAWALRLAAALGHAGSPRARQARRVLEAHLLPDGGITTYQEHIFRFLPGKPRVAAEGTGGNATSHPCVTAGAAGLGDARLLDFLRRTQRDDGSWPAYWWEDDEFSTALAAEGLAATGRAADRPRVAAAIRWASERLGPGGAVRSAAHAADSAYATAWCVRILALATDPAALEAPVGWLLREQGPDGAWPASAWLLAARSRSPERGEGTTPLASLDDGSVTTVIVVTALAAAGARLSSGAAMGRSSLTGTPA